MILGVVDIVCWYACGIGAVASISVGALGHRKAIVLRFFLPPAYGG